MTHTLKHVTYLGLYKRREKLCLNFCKKELKKPNCGIFKKHYNLRTKRKFAKNRVVEEPFTRTVRYAKSSIPYLSKLLNTHMGEC